MILGVVTLALAIVSAFAFRPAKLLNTPGYGTTSNCQRATAVCDGSSQDCRVDIPEVAGTGLVTIKDFDTNCADVLKMP